MTAILRRELSSYFGSPIGYIFLSVFFVFAGIFFLFASLLSNSASIASVYSNLLTVILFLVPLLTMRLFSEDNKNKTDQALLTAPVSLTGIVLGKFFAALLVFALGLAITLVYGVVIALFTPPSWSEIFSNFLAMLMMGGALIAIGMFISSLTENQVIAAVGGFAAGFALLLMDMFSSLTSTPWLSSFISSLSFLSRYSTFINGIFNASSILFFVSVAFLFCFFTVRVLEKRRWS